MAIDREELKKKAMEAASAEEVMEIVRAAGEEITAEEAASFFKAVQERKADKELALDELEAVSGGQKWGNGVLGPGLFDGGLRRHGGARQSLLGHGRRLYCRRQILFA